MQNKKIIKRLVTLEEISTIIEENEDVRNYIEKSSDEDCGCEDDSTQPNGVSSYL